jgi:hypothetical protein
MDAYKTFISVILSSALTILNPLFNPVIILVVLFIFDIVCGIISDKIINKTHFSFSKFLRAVLFLALYIVIITAIYVICWLQNDIQEGETLLKVITYVCSYFYFSNIARNLHETYTDNRFFAFLFYVLSVDLFTSKLPILQKFLNQEKKQKNENTD